MLKVLTTQADACRASHHAWLEAAQRAAVADTAVDIARLKVVGVYNDNIIDIRRACARSAAPASHGRCAPDRRARGGVRRQLRALR